MPDNTKPIEDEREAQGSRPRYEPPMLLDLGELSRGQGTGCCLSGPANSDCCDVGASASPN